MKKILILACALCLAVTSCSKEKKNEQPKSETKKSVVNEQTEAPSEPGAEVNAGDLFDKLKQNLIDAGYTIDEEIKMAGEMVGALEGKAFKLSDGQKVEVYKFDVNSDVYKKISETRKIELEGFGEFDAIANNGYVISHNVDEIIIGIFNGL